MQITAAVNLPAPNRRSTDYKKDSRRITLASLSPFFEVPVVASSKTTHEDHKDEANSNQIQSRTIMSNFFNRLIAEPRDYLLNSIVVSSSCAGEPLNFSQLLTCIGVTVQQTSTYTATLTVTQTTTSGSTKITLGGCTPTNFPYPACKA
jgi:hypothetical protein